jgi:hypothetical protein
MSKTTIAAWALGALVLGIGAGGSESRAQVVVGDVPAAPEGFGVSFIPTAPPFPYSYAAAFPHPAREYVPYSAGDIFPYRGQPYGHPYDRWTWTYLAGYNGLMSRYYYPPVR